MEENRGFGAPGVNLIGLNYVEVANNAVFYGPKTDVRVWSAIGRECTIATNQVAFAVPAKFGLIYRDRTTRQLNKASGKSHLTLCIIVLIH